MMDITCDSCGKKYRIDETKMRKESAKVKCKTCDHIMVISKPAPEPEFDAPIPEEFAERGLTQEVEVPRSVVDQPAAARPSVESEPEPEKEVPAYVGGQRVRLAEDRIRSIRYGRTEEGQ